MGPPAWPVPALPWVPAQGRDDRWRGRRCSARNISTIGPHDSEFRLEVLRRGAGSVQSSPGSYQLALKRTHDDGGRRCEPLTPFFGVGSVKNLQG